MKKRKLLFTLLALGLGAFLGGSRAMAQNGWESLYTPSQTSSASWTAINSGSSTGLTLGDGANTTRYYYVTTNNLNFTNSTAGGSGLTISGTVYLYIPAGLQITCRGANASGTTGAGAGIELAAGNTLYIIGGGTVKAYGGNAANGGNGGRGNNANFDYNDYCQPGSGGSGGNGGGGAGAGIGTRGGTGGTGGSGGSAKRDEDEGTNKGVDGNYGTAGSTAGAMGTLYVASDVTVNATGGSKGSNGTGGDRGWNAAEDPYNQYSASGGGGGGAGGFGGAAVNIGIGGPGGGGGGGGAAGNSAWRANSTNGFYRVGAGGGSGGYNGDGSKAPDGTTSLLTNPYSAEYNEGLSGDYDDDGLEASNTPATGGPGQEAGGESTEGTVNEGSKTYTITYNPIVTNVNGKTDNKLNSLTVTYSPGAPNIVLPANTEGYNWVLTTYGKSCAPNGVAANTFAQATTEYFGGTGDETSRTITPVNVYGDLVFQEVATMLMMECSTSGENTNNDQEILEYYTYGYNVTARLQNRTLYRDNHWNTICLPFAMTPAQIANSPLAGATIKKMNQTRSGYYAIKQNYESIGFDHPVVLFWFDTVESTESLVAGKPYLVKWTEPYEHSDDGNYVDNTAKGGSRHELDFPGVTITATQPGAWTGSATVSGDVTFQGTFSLSADLSATDADGNMNLVLGANDKLYHPSETMNAGACRGYFKIPEAAVSAAPQFVMGFDDDETTGIQTIDITPEGWNNAPAIYNLSGQRLNSLQKGVNIVNGKKVVVK